MELGPPVVPMGSFFKTLVWFMQKVLLPVVPVVIGDARTEKVLLGATVVGPVLGAL